MRKLNRVSFAAVAVAAFAMACADPSSPDVRKTDLGGPSPTVTDAVNGVGFSYPSGMTAGEVRVCKSVPADDPAGVQFSFTVTTLGVVPPGGATGPTVHNIVGVPGSALACTDVFLSTKTGAELDSVRIVESAPPPGWALTEINTLRIDDGPGYTPPNSGLISGDVVVEDVPSRAVSLYINGDMGRIVTFTNDFTAEEEDGCTLTQGYWKNHTGEWPAGAGFGPGAAFFGTGITYLQAITIEEDGNAFFILSRQYVAALLNIANGASTTPAVDQALIDAAALFAAKVNTVGPVNPARQQWITLAGILDQYNRGLIGPGKCTG